jgi:hypothetical protein
MGARVHAMKASYLFALSRQFTRDALASPFLNLLNLAAHSSLLSDCMTVYRPNLGDYNRIAMVGFAAVFWRA